MFAMCGVSCPPQLVADVASEQKLVQLFFPSSQFGFYINENLKTPKENYSGNLCPNKLKSQDESISSRDG